MRGRFPFPLPLVRPASMPFIHAEQKFNYEETRDGETVVHHWSGHFQIPQSTEPNIADLTSRLPRWSFSTFRNYDEIGTAFYDGAKARLEVTPAITDLAVRPHSFASVVRMAVG